MLKIKNNDYAFFKGIECRFWQIEENLYRLQTSFKEGYWIQDLKDMKIAKQMSFYQIKFS